VHDLTALFEHAAREYPAEACGLVVRRGGGLVALPGRNLAPRGRFELDPATLIAARSEPLHAIYHSHCDAPAALSAADRRGWMLGDQPAWPGVELWIVPVRRGIAGAPVRYTWDAARGDFSMRS